MPLSEKATRKQLIDKVLLSSGWEPIIRAGSERQRAFAALEEYPTENGPADYALFHREQPLAIVEAKKLAVGPQNVLQQALRYASGFDDSPFNFKLVDGKKGKEWKVRYSNPAAADKAKQTLFIFFSHSGNFIAANFTGQ